jgi:hypothetical protein
MAYGYPAVVAGTNVVVSKTKFSGVRTVAAPVVLKRSWKVGLTPLTTGA